MVLLAAVAFLAPATGAANDGRRLEIPANPESLVPRAFSVPIPDPGPHRHELVRGAVAWIVPDDSVPMVQVVVVLPAGEDRDPPGSRGLAGLTAASLRRGGAGARDAAAFDLAVDRLAAELDSFAGAHRAGAVLDVGSWHLTEGLDLLFDMLGRPRFEEERVRFVRRNLAEGIAAGRTDPAVIGSRAWEAATARPGEPLAEPLDPERIQELEREDLVAFHGRRWRPEEMVFAIAGAVESERVVTELNRRLLALPAVEPSHRQAPEPPNVPEEPPLPPFLTVDTPIAGAVVLVGQRLPPTRLDPADRYAALLLEELAAGGGSVNRFVGRLRTDLGLVYAVDAELDLADDRFGRWLGLFHCPPSAVGPALTAWREALAGLREEPVPESILEAARRAILGRLRVRFDTASGIAGTWAEDELVGRHHAFWIEMAAGLDAVTPGRVRAVARQLLDPEDLTVVVVGPEAEVRRSLEAAETLPERWRRGGRRR